MLNQKLESKDVDNLINSLNGVKAKYSKKINSEDPNSLKR